MTSPEHYRRAENLLAWIEAIQPADLRRIRRSERRGRRTPLTQCIAEAQVHATLALAAATGLNDADTGFSGPDWAAWRHIAGVKQDSDGAS